MDILWLVVFWSTILTGSVLMQFYRFYWQSGHFSRWGKAKFALNRIKILALVGLLAIIIFAGVLLYFFEHSIVYQLINAAMIGSYTYSMLVLVLLLSHGLSKMPFYLWRSNTCYYGLLNDLERADGLKRAYKESKLEYHEVMTICRVTSEKHADPYNSRWLDKLLEEIPTTDLEGNKVHKLRSIQNLELPRGKSVNELYIANLRFRHKMSYLNYVRSRATWLEVYQSVIDSVKQPIDYKPEDLKRKAPVVASDYLESKTVIADGQLVLQPKEKEQCTRHLYRLAGAATAFWAIFIFATELTVCISAKYTLTNLIAEAIPEQRFLNFLIGVLFLSGLVATCMFSVVNSRVSESMYKLRPG